MDKYKIDDGQEELKYPEYLKAYINKHKISEFVTINPLLKKFTASTDLILKIDIESTSELGRIKNLKSAVADILGLKSAAIRLLDIKDGCVVVTFLIPTPLAEVIFNRETIFTEEQLAKLQALDILWLRCNGHTFELTCEDKDPE